MPAARRKAVVDGSVEPSTTVKVACRLNNGLIIEAFDQAPDASTGLPRIEATARVELVGTRAVRDSSTVAIRDGGEYAVTEVPRPLWEAWLAANAESSLVKNGIVFAVE